MKTNLILTSAIAMFVAMPSMAEPSNTGTFPSDGKMQADYTYTNAATSDNMAGVYENSVYANAQYTTNDYTVNAGYYLPADSENPNTTCTAGSFCPGLQSPVQYNATTAQGINACPTGYTNSAEGASANTECYRTCSNSDVAHASSVSGQMYYDGTSGDGVNACSAEGCLNGWHVKSSISGSELQTIIGNGAGENSAVIDIHGSFRQKAFNGGTDHEQSFYGITEKHTWAVNYGSGKGIVTGQGRCSTQSGTSNSVVSNLTDETEQTGARYCYCTVTGYKDTNGTMQSLSAHWVFNRDISDAPSCASNCANECAGALQSDFFVNLSFRARVLGAVQSSPASCEANTITINWSDAAQTDIDANNAGSVTYGGNINTPVKAATKKGKTFRGWIFSTTAPSNE